MVTGRLRLFSSRRIVQVIGVALLSFFGWQVAAQTNQFAFSTTAQSTTIQETSDSTDLETIRGLITSARNDSVSSHFTFKLDARSAVKFDLDPGLATLEFKTGQKLDYETPSDRSFQIIVIAEKNADAPATSSANTLTLSLTLTNVDERPEVLPEFQGENGKVYYFQKRPAYTPVRSIFSGQVFRDPEGAAIQFKPCADDFQVAEWDDANSDSADADSTRGTILADISTGGTLVANHCAETADDATRASNTDDPTKSGHVVNVQTLPTSNSPIFRLTTIESDRGGTQRAQIKFRGWAGTPVQGDPLDVATLPTLSDEATITIYVKTGANSIPRYAETGWAVTVNESIDDSVVDIGPPSGSSWATTDLDGDRLTYSLEGSPAPATCVDAAEMSIEGAVGLGKGCAWIEVAADGTFKVKGKNLDFESAPASGIYTIQLVAEDGYPGGVARVPINITIRNVDEGLEFEGPIDKISQLVVGRAGRSVDLNDHFSDPDGGVITYRVFSSNPNLVSAVLSGSILSVSPTGGTGTATVSITATDAGGTSRSHPITISIRQSNAPPNFIGSPIQVQSNSAINENQASGHVVRVSALRYIDPDGDTITATVLNSTLFEAVVDPEIGTQTHKGEVGLRLIGTLDFETNQQHEVEIRLNDGWDSSIQTVRVRVAVNDINEPPTVATDQLGNPRTIPDQSVSINGTGSLSIAEYFEDPDGGRLNYSAVVTSGAGNVSVSVEGVATIQFQGITPSEGNPAVITVTATDSGGLRVSTTFRVTVLSNTPPVLANQPENQTITLSGGPVTVSLIGTFTDNDPDDRISRYETSSNDDRVVIAQIDRTGLSMVLIPRSEGSTSVVITAIDSRGGRADTTISITVLGNTKPILKGRIPTVTLRPDSSTSINLSNYFEDPDGDTLTYVTRALTPGVVTTSVAVNQLSLQADVTSTSNTTVQVTATDPDGEFVRTTFVVNVVNDAPVTSTPISLDLAHRGDSDTVDLNNIFTDADGDRLTFTASVADESVAVASIDSANVLTVEGVGVGNTRVTVEAIDEFGLSATSSFSLKIVNQAPVLEMSIADQRIFRGEDIEIDLTDFFSDPDNDSLTFSASSTSGRTATATVSGSVLTITGFSLGLVTVTVNATDDYQGTVRETFQVTVENRNPQTIAEIEDQTTHRGLAMMLDLTTVFSDPDGDALTYSIDVRDNAIVRAEIDGTNLIFTGVGVGETTISVSAVDPTGTPATSSFVVTIENRAPEVVKEIDDQATYRTGTIAIDLAEIFNDPDDDVLEYKASVGSRVVASTSITGSMLTITGLAVNSTNIEVTASDAYGGSANTTFAVTIENRAPVLANQPANVTLNRTEAPMIDLADTFSDADGDALSISAVSSLASVATVNVNGKMLSIQPLTVGTTQISLTATDIYNATAEASFEVTVENLAPRLANGIDNMTTNRRDVSTIDVSMVFIDDDDDELTLTASSTDTDVVEASVTGTTMTINGVDLGTAVVTLEATDAIGARVRTSFQVTVVNLDPTTTDVEIVDFLLQVGGDAVAQDVSGAFQDEGTVPLVITATVGNEVVASAMVDEMTVTVTPLAKGRTAITITATDAQGASVSATANVSVSEDEIKAVANTALASFSRAVLNSMSSTVGARLLADSDGLYSQFTTYSFDDFAPTDGFSGTHLQDGWNPSPFDNTNDGWSQVSLRNQNKGLGQDYNQLRGLIGNGFAMKLAAAGDPTFWSIWGGLDNQSFEAPDHEGSATSFYFGGDMTIQGQWTFGVAIGRSAGEVDYTYGSATQTMENELTQILPYARMSLSDRTTVYGAFGVGSGSLETTVTGHQGIEPSDLKATLGLFGGRQVLYTMGNGLSLAFVGDFGFVNLETDDLTNSAGGLVAETSRFRGGVETSLNMLMGNQGSFTPFLTLNFRADGGDGLAESGVEIVGGVRISSPIFSLDANLRSLVTYGADDYSETGISLMAHVNPTGGVTGLNIAVNPSWGAQTRSTDALWRDDFQANQIPDLASWGLPEGDKFRLESNIGYGFLVVDERFVLTPFIDVQSGYLQGRDMSFGAQFKALQRSLHNLNVNFQIGQDSMLTGTQDDMVELKARLNF